MSPNSEHVSFIISLPSHDLLTSQICTVKLICASSKIDKSDNLTATLGKPLYCCSWPAGDNTSVSREAVSAAITTPLIHKDLNYSITISKSL